MNQLPTVLIRVTSRDPNSALAKLLTAKPSKKEAVSQNSNALITKMNSPKVRSVIGRVRKTNTGRTKTFSNPSTNAAIRAGYRPSTVTPGINLATISSASAVTKIRAINFIILKHTPPSTHWSN